MYTTGRSVRNPFTEREDNLLVKYIAQHNPIPSGRSGQNLYKTLEENAGNKWPWSRTHTWQSWRERYKKNQELFDSKIKRYLREKKTATTQENGRVAGKAEGTVSKPRREEDNKVRQQTNGSVTKPSKSSNHPALNGSESQAHQRPRGEGANERTSAKDDTASSNTSGDEAEAEVADDELMHELFGSYVEESQEQGEELIPDSEEEHAALEPPTVVESIYPKLPVGVAEQEPHIPGAFESEDAPQNHFLPTPPPARPASRVEPAKASPPDRPINKKPKPKLRRSARDEDPFATPSESSPPPPRPQYKPAGAGLPVLVENGFRSALKRPRRSSPDDPNAAPWPPKRAKTSAPAERPKERTEGVQRMDVDNVSHVPPTKTSHGLPTRRPVHVNAVASSSKTMLTPTTTVTPNLKPSAQPNVVESISVQTTRIVSAAEPRPIKIESPQSFSPVFKILSRKPHTLVYAPPARPLSDSDPFTAKKVTEKDKGKARADVVPNNNQPPKIDLHKESLQRRLTNTSMSISAAGSTSYASSSSGARKKGRSSGEKHNSLRKSLTTGITPSDPDFELVVTAVEDVTKTLAQMAATYGIGEQHAKAAYIRTRSLEKTKFVLQQLRDAIAEKEKAIYAALPEPDDEVDTLEGGDSDEEVPDGLVLRSKVETAERLRQKQSKRPSKSPIKSPRSSGRPSLSIRPLPEGDSHILDTEYSPPPGSRAGTFARLMKQGRASEAFEREKRRVSGMFIPDTQHRRQSSPPPMAASPTPRSQAREALEEINNNNEPIAGNTAPEGEAVDVDDDDIYLLDDEIDREADDESNDKEDEDEKKMPSSPPFPTIKALINRLSGGRDNEPAFLAKAERHRELALAAEAENDGELRQFEKEHNKGMLRLWSVLWAQEMLKAFPQDRKDEPTEA
ncbi:hypothetical protein BDN70DRAFT_919906 [Pholiota conissans]|uniref:TERF2-interacting telomeric protein 1 Myb domain-containing protein n=1 Tax=Pholiota conissans TaxID=109636 RepID=A0A9P5Z5P3_9AGAR|nr:hypothetical protein BDN70DRAFT_919906 [Pholiota conissans]